jgi:hypothetical protein
MDKKWTGGYEGGKVDERPEGDAPTSVHFSAVIGKILDHAQVRVLRDRVQVGTITVANVEEAEWLAAKMVGSFPLPKRYD